MRYVLGLLAILAVGLLPQYFAVADTLPIGHVDIQRSGGTSSFTVEIAEDRDSRAQGLMHREEMAADHGMLFVFDLPSEQVFWMKNTPLSLDIIFISKDQRIIHIAENTTPFSLDAIPSHGKALYVLEVLGGTAEKLGISKGDSVTIRR
ncbi:DUF192 domain-containing protein [Rhodobacteraceae bacterium RKSG542]|uniref:DUF192 domain-containing protein n=1 Tax=Pseudovibrio flavus TaxID=2529854 RepID=UPI0012BC0196|nr:DUF192 domain-containing protein [Pseudovibrio flavus]MTI17572.1 DUF192 domain-containing protein [Pseudovibrio flavus]